MKSYLAIISIALSALCSPAVWSASTPFLRQEHVQVRLISDVDIAVAGDSFKIGLELRPDSEWHVYWRNPGDSGMPVSVSWELPEGLSASEIRWPFPHKIPYGDLINYGYEGAVVLPTVMSVDKANIKETSDSEAAGSKTRELSIAGNASWLVCKDICIPGNAELRLKIPLGAKKTLAPEVTRINEFVQREALTLPLLNGEIVSGQDIKLELFATKAVFRNAKHIEFFPINEALFEASAKADMHWNNNVIRITQQKSSSYLSMPVTVSGVLVVDHQQAYEFSFDTR